MISSTLNPALIYCWICMYMALLRGLWLLRHYRRVGQSRSEGSRFKRLFLLPALKDGQRKTNSLHNIWWVNSFIKKNVELHGLSLQQWNVSVCSKEQMSKKHLCAGKGNISLNILEQTWLIELPFPSAWCVSLLCRQDPARFAGYELQVTFKFITMEWFV